MLKNHGWGNPVVWISFAGPQTARVQLLARHLSPTSGLQRVLLCEIEKNGQTISRQASARLKSTGKAKRVFSTEVLAVGGQFLRFGHFSSYS